MYFTVSNAVSDIVYLVFDKKKKFNYQYIIETPADIYEKIDVLSSATTTMFFNSSFIYLFETSSVKFTPFYIF